MACAMCQGELSRDRVICDKCHLEHPQSEITKALRRHLEETIRPILEGKDESAIKP